MVPCEIEASHGVEYPYDPSDTPDPSECTRESRGEYENEYVDDDECDDRDTIPQHISEISTYVCTHEIEVRSYIHLPRRIYRSYRDHDREPSSQTYREYRYDEEHYEHTKESIEYYISAILIVRYHHYHEVS